MLVHQNGLVKITDEMPLDLAALIGCGVTTGMGAVFRTAAVEPGAGSRDRRRRHRPLRHPGRPHRRRRAGDRGRRVRRGSSRPPRSWAGPTWSTPARSTTSVAAVKELSRGGVDYSFEAIGLKATSEQAFNMLDRGGTATVIGMVPSNQKLEIKGMDLFGRRRSCRAR